MPIKNTIQMTNDRPIHRLLPMAVQYIFFKGTIKSFIVGQRILYKLIIVDLAVNSNPDIFKMILRFVML